MNSIALKKINSEGRSSFQVLDAAGAPVDRISKFLRALELRGLSQHTLRAYAYDLVIFLVHRRCGPSGIR